MATPLALVWDLIAHDNASAGFRKVGAAAGATAKETEAMGTKFAKAGTLIGVAAVGVAAVSTKMAISFEESTTKLVTGAGESEDAIGKVRKGILEMAGAVGTAPEELSKGMFLIESAGYHGAKGLDVLHAAAEGAKVGGADMATVADGLTTAMKDYAIPTSRAADITSKLVATVAAGKTNMGDLSTALAKVLPFSSNLGISLNETMGAMATMTGAGIDAATSATMLKFSMMSLSNETPKGAKALLSVGLSAQQVTKDLAGKGLQATLTEIIDAIGKKFPVGSAAYNKALSAVVGGTRGMGAALALSGKHAKDFAANTKSVGSAAADADGHVKNFNITQKDMAFKVDAAKAAVSAFAIELGDELLPKITTAIKFFTDHKTVTKDLGIAIGATAAFLVTYSVVTKVATAATATYGLAMRLLGVNMAATAVATEGAVAAQTELDVAMDANPIGAVVLGVGLLAAAYMHFKPHADSATKAEHNYAKSLGDVTGWLNKQTGALTKSATATINKQLADSDAYVAARKMGISLKDVLSAAEGNSDAMERVKNLTNLYSTALSDNSAHQKLAAKNIAILMGAVGGTTESIKKSRQALIDQAEASGKSKAEVDKLKRAFDAASKSVKDLGKQKAKPTVSTKSIDTAIGKARTLLGLLSGLGNSHVSTKSVPGMFQPKKHARGTTNAPGGWSLVGEEGPELVNLTRGAQVIPNNKIGDVGAGGGLSAADIKAAVVAGVREGMHGTSFDLNRDNRSLTAKVRRG